MKSLLLPFWPGLLLAICVRVGPWVCLATFGFFGDTFYSGVFAGLGVVMAANSLDKLIKELRASE